MNITGHFLASGRLGANIALNLAQWQPTTDYEQNDLVAFGTDIVICTSTHTSSAIFATDAANWQNIGGSSVYVPDWMPSQSYVQNELAYHLDNSGDNVPTLFRRTASGTSGAVFDPAEESTWTAVSNWVDGGSAMATAVTGLPTKDQSDNAYRTGFTGFGETSPAELVDIVGTEAQATGAFKFDYTYATGEIARAQFGGQNLLSELGLPAGHIKGNLLDYFGIGNQAGYRAYMYNGNIDNLSPGAGKLSWGAGVHELASPDHTALFSVFPSGNDDGTNFVARVQAQDLEGIANLQAVAKYPNVEFGSVPIVDQNAIFDGNGDLSNAASTYTRLSPHEYRISALAKLVQYGVGTFVQSYVHNDLRVNTAQDNVATTIGAATYGLGVDSAGVVMEIPLASLSGAQTEIDNGLSGAAQNIDFSTNKFHKSTVSANATYTFTAPSALATVQLKLVQNATGSFTTQLPTNIYWSGGIYGHTGTPNSIDIVELYFDGTNWFGSFKKDFLLAI